MIIKILGTGCTKCKLTQEIIEQTAKELGIKPEILKVEDLEEIMKYDVMATPAVVIDGKVEISGKVPSKDEMKALFSR
jgi:small redox-active disulfide protein 2